MKISDSVIVITGASSGIGRATALQAAQQGACLVLASRQLDALQEVARECERLGVRALAVAADVTVEQEVQSVASHAKAVFGRIDAWVNDAAVTMLAAFEQAPPEAFRRVIETNFFGYVHGARAALPHFREQRCGVLVNVASELGKFGAPFASAYVASKFAVTGFSESLRMELRNEPQIHVCTIFPSTIDTPLFQHAANFTGKALQAPPPVYQPETVAAAILKCIEKPRREVLVGNVGRRLNFRRVVPRLAERVIARKINREHFRKKRVPGSAGNLFDPMPGLNCVHGGWADGQSRIKPGMGLVLLAGGLGFLTLLLLRSKRPSTATETQHSATADLRRQVVAAIKSTGSALL